MTARIKPPHIKFKCEYLSQLAVFTYELRAIISCIYHYPGAKRPVVITKYKEVPVFVIRNNMKVIGMSVDEYNSILDKI